MVMCRACMVTKGEMVALDEMFVSNFNALTNLNIQLNDDLPQFSCQDCITALNFCIDFQKKALACEIMLRNLFSGDLKVEGFQTEDVYDMNNSKEEDNVMIKCEFKPEKQEQSLDYEDFIDIDESINKILVPCDAEKMPNNCKDKKKTKHKKQSTDKKERFKRDIYKQPCIEEYSCGLCKKTFKDLNAMQVHLTSHKNNKYCEVCSEKLRSWSQALGHRLTHLPVKQKRCHICFQRFVSCMYMEYHYIKKHNFEQVNRGLQCEHCLSTYKTPRHLSKHIWYSHSDLKYICDHCSKCFRVKSALISHIRSHSDKKAFVCDLCGASFKHLPALKEHNIRKHVHRKRYCKRCTRVFQYDQAYDKHIVACGKIKFMCPICGHQFARNSMLNRHIKSHSEATMFSCDRCPAKYKSKQALIVHLNRHDGIRSKCCEYCPAKFYSATSLIKHRRIHTGEKPYVCKVCSKGFTANHNLKVHMKVHGENLIVKKVSNTDK